MNTISRTMTGGIMIVMGLILVGTSFFTNFILLIYGVPIFIIGIFILLNTKEDEIEQIKSKSRKKK